MEYLRCQPPCSCFIVSDDPHSKCVKYMVFLHAREAVFCISKLNCENLRLKTLRCRLKVFERESSIFPRHAPEASAALFESATWCSDVELEVMQNEQRGLALSLPLSPEHVRANSQFEFAH